MRSPPSSSPRFSPRLKLGLLFFVLMPCLPGLVFLLAGFTTDPHRQPRDSSPAGVLRFAEAWNRTRLLYVTGALVTMVGTLGSAVVIWKIVRVGQADEAKAATAP